MQNYLVWNLLLFFTILKKKKKKKIRVFFFESHAKNKTFCISLEIKRQKAIASYIDWKLSLILSSLEIVFSLTKSFLFWWNFFLLEIPIDAKVFSLLRFQLFFYNSIFYSENFTKNKTFCISSEVKHQKSNVT